MCTSLGYKDASGNAYFGRTLELTVDLPYQVTFFPSGFATTSEIGGHAPLKYTSRFAIIAVTMPYRVPTAAAPMGIADLKILEGLNEGDRMVVEGAFVLKAQRLKSKLGEGHAH